MKKVVFLLYCIIFCFQYGFPQGSPSINLSGLEAFEAPSKNWIIVSDVLMGLTQSNLKTLNGTGILVSKPMKGLGNLVFKEQLEGDIELNLNFMTTRNSNAANHLIRQLDQATALFTVSGHA